jgi:hypothetical protein
MHRQPAGGEACFTTTPSPGRRQTSIAKHGVAVRCGQALCRLHNVCIAKQLENRMWATAPKAFFAEVDIRHFSLANTHSNTKDRVEAAQSAARTHAVTLQGRHSEIQTTIG